MVDKVVIEKGYRYGGDVIYKVQVPCLIKSKLEATFFKSSNLFMEFNITVSIIRCS